VTPESMILQDNGDENTCTAHGKWSSGHHWLAHQLVGRLGLVSSEYSSLILEAASGNGGDGGDGDDGSGGRSLVDMLVENIKRCAVAPWLVPVNRGHFEVDCRYILQVIRGNANCWLSFVHGDAECVALGGWKEISVYNLEGGDLVQQLHDEGAGMIMYLSVGWRGIWGETSKGGRCRS
jgi:hypothetical protein